MSDKIKSPSEKELYFFLTFKQILSYFDFLFELYFNET